ncbi:MAG TPA: hypothetical protein VF016_01535 [Nitrososphaera sp.]
MAEDIGSSSSQHGTAGINDDNGDNNIAGRPAQGHFLYADYTPLEDDRNLIGMLKSFVSLTSQVIQRHEVDVKCMSLLDGSELLRKEIVSAIRNARAAATDIIDRFYEKNSGIFSSVAGLQSASGNTFLTDAKTSIARMLADVETSSSQQQEKYKENIRSVINANRTAAITAVQNWLSIENRNFPRPVLDSLSVELAAHIDPATNNNSYKVVRTASASIANIASNKKEEGEEKKKGNEKVTAAATAASTLPTQFSYVFEFASTGIEFWNYRKKVFDFGTRDLMLPVGMKLPMSEKVKSTFRFSKKEEQTAKEEPQFAKADDLYISSVALRGEKTFEVGLASDIASGPAGEGGGKGEFFTVAFDMASLASDSYTRTVNLASPTIRPRIYYTNNKEQATAAAAETDLLQTREIEQATDLYKLVAFGRAVLEKMRLLQEPGILASKGRLKLLAVEEKDAIAAAAPGHSAGAAGSGVMVFVEYSLLFDLLEALARSFGPAVGKLKDKTPVKEELILRQELEGGQRKEFAAKLDDLRAQLGETPYGKLMFRTVLGA